MPTFVHFGPIIYYMYIAEFVLLVSDVQKVDEEIEKNSNPCN